MSVSHYRVLELLGEGGMGEVYKAVDVRIGRIVAVKFMKEGFDQRFRQETAAISSLNHPNIATLFDVGEHEGTPYLVMEFVEGETVHEKVARGCLPPREVKKLGIQVAAALEEAHGRGVIHRDLKPANIIVTAKDLVKVLDFGLAKLLRRTGADDSTRTLSAGLGLTGTLPYMAPEQLRNEPADERTDIHGLGVVLYEMSTGERPFSGDTVAMLTDAILHRDPAAPSELTPSVPPGVERVILRCLKKERQERYQSVAEARADLERASLETGAAAIPARLWSAVAGSKRRRGLSLAVAALVLALPFAVRYVWALKPLTERDTILIADFENGTGDALLSGVALKDALTFKLTESPFLNVYAPEDLRAALRLMGRATDAKIDEDTGREICIRQGLKAMVVGSVAPIGNRYLIQLKVVAPETRRLLAMTEAEAGSKEELVQQLGRAATELRQKAGESIASIRRFDVPLEQATTPSLEALKAFSTGTELRDRGQFLDALAHYRRATEMDPNFALAFAHMGLMYGNADQRGLMRESITKAYSLRQRVSERERLIIEVRYFDSVLEDLHRTMEAELVLAQTYPRYWMAQNNLGAHYRTIGRHEEAIVRFQEAARLSPRSAGYVNSNLAWTHLFLNRFQEAQACSHKALAAGFDTGGVHQLLYQLAAIQGDTAAMEKQAGWFAAKPQEYLAHRWRGDFAAFSGEFGKARRFYESAAELAGRQKLKERVAIERAWSAAIDAQAGFCADIATRTGKALAESRETSVLRDSANALAECGHVEQAEALMQELSRQHPKSTYVSEFLLPNFLALAQIKRGDFQRAVDLLQPMLGYENTPLGMRAAYLRGTAHMRLGDAKAAAAEFRKITARRGLDALSVLWPLAHLQLGRALAASGDKVSARQAYGEFLKLWKNADASIAALKEARAESGGL